MMESIDDGLIRATATRERIRGKRPRALEIFETAKQQQRPVHVTAPMVRYSKLPFRLLVRSYDVDITFVPMMLAHEFVRSAIARDSDFTTHPLEREATPGPDKGGFYRQHAVIAQFASSDPTELARAAVLVEPWVDGVDLNCGCPQRWAVNEGIGCSLMDKPDLVADMVRTVKSRIGPDKSVSCKIRIHKDLSQTVRWIRAVEMAGVDFITIHGRTRHQRSSTPPNYEAIRYLKSEANVPVIANGDVYNLTDVEHMVRLTAVDGVMAARGILQNPALFAGWPATPDQCVRKFVELAMICPIPFALVLHHVNEMVARMPGMTKNEKKLLMSCQDLLDLVDYVEARWPDDKTK